jgi:uncharacterized protein
VPAVASIAIGLPSRASAHVEIVPKSARCGEPAALTFRVPNERTSVATTGLVVQFPRDRPISSATARAAAGWSARVRMRNAGPAPAVDTIAWSGGAIRPGSVGSFAVSTGLLPAHGDALVFKALQTYANGEVVRWVQVQGPGEPEPPNPAPVLALRDRSGAVCR